MSAVYFYNSLIVAVICILYFVNPAKSSESLTIIHYVHDDSSYEIILFHLGINYHLLKVESVSYVGYKLQTQA